MPDETQSPQLVEHFFRHEYGRLVSRLSRKFGIHNLERVEDAVQSALASALGTWSSRGIPDKPAAWLYRVAHNEVTDCFRRDAVAGRAQAKLDLPEESRNDEHGLSLEISDDTLRMLFVCCDEALPSRTQLVLALKIICGFSVREIAFRLMKTEASIHKRITRGRAQMRELSGDLAAPNNEEMGGRLHTLCSVLYLLFNEGYSSTIADQPIRRELCAEAIRLCQILVGHPVGDLPEAWALLALMHMHHARLDARVSGAGALLLLEEQDRSQWDKNEINAGLLALHHSTEGRVFSKYHAEAGILVEHCMAPRYEDTRWEKIVELYILLEKCEPSPIYTLNRAIAVAAWKGAEAGLAVLEKVDPPSWLLGYYLWDATWGELYRRAGKLDLAKKHLSRALDTTPTDAEKVRLRSRLAACDPAE